MPLRCAEHPDVETYLRCGKCYTPICPRCMVQTPVGARCRQCARLRPPVVEQVPAPLFARSAAAGVGAALAVGLGINAGHDLNRDNLHTFLATVPGVQEVSIGHALISDALELGYTQTVRAYNACMPKA